MPTEKRTSRRVSRKGTFAQGRLPTSAYYVALDRRRAMLWMGLALALVFAVVAAADMWRGDSRLVSGGALSSAHATLDADCGSCHVPGKGAVSQRCIDCHEQQLSGPAHTGVFVLTAHAERFGVPSGPVTGETECSTCHEEHLGRQHSPSLVADTSCRSCHEIEAFEVGHPEFELVADSTGSLEAEQPAPIAFAHVHHTQELLRTGKAANVLGSCANCHEPDNDGSGFAAIVFERHCGSCHLNGGQATEWLALASDERPMGVLGLTDLERAMGGGRALGNSADFRQRRGNVRKTGVRHADPWILGNLQRLRRQAYVTSPLADLLPSAPRPEESGEATQELYRGAITALESQLEALRSSADSSTRSELREIEAHLAEARARLAAAGGQLSTEPFAVGAPRTQEGVTSAEVQDLVRDLVANCTQCHLVERMTLVQPPASSSLLPRAEFHHGAHVLQASCLECHDRIEGLTLLARGEEVDAEVAAAASDRAETVNLPGISSCTGCHRETEADASCTLCHGYHAQRSDSHLLATSVLP